MKQVVVQEGLSEKVTSEKRPEGEGTMGRCVGKASQAEGTARHGPRGEHMPDVMEELGEGSNG